jgi:mannose-6-phosphate isomerase-like protein (cupin superfamily)
MWNVGDAEETIMPFLRKINLEQAFASFDETWSPRIGGDVNDLQIKLAKFAGEFHWHHHEQEDELFLVIQGRLRMQLRPADGGDVVLGPGEYIVVPRGIEHCPKAEPTCDVLLLEKSSTLNSGNVENDRTVRHLGRIDGI